MKIKVAKCELCSLLEKALQCFEQKILIKFMGNKTFPRITILGKKASMDAPGFSVVPGNLLPAFKENDSIFSKQASQLPRSWMKYCFAIIKLCCFNGSKNPLCSFYVLHLKSLNIKLILNLSIYFMWLSFL